MKKGFTLVEIMAVIIVLGVIALIAFPSVNSMIKAGREDLYEEQLEEIKLASKKWAFNNTKLLPDNDGQSITITLLQLKRAGYLPLDIRNPKTNELLSNGLSIVITYKNNDYEYKIKEVITNTDITSDSPTIILNGEALETLEINSEYTEKGAIATDSEGNEMESVIIAYYKNGKEVASVSTDELGTYTIEYSVTDNSKKLTTIVTRTVIIKDTIAPTITLPDKVTITQSAAATYDLMEGVSIIDNSKKEPTIEITGFTTTVGEKIVNYKACDSSGNCDNKNRIIIVN